jgi:hypothetical protein
LTWQLILNLYLIQSELKYDVFNFNGAKESNSIEAILQPFQPDEQEEVRDQRRQRKELVPLPKPDEREHL